MNASGAKPLNTDDGEIDEAILVDQLKAAGFSVDPLILIGDALRESQTRSALPTPMRNG